MKFLPTLADYGMTKQITKLDKDVFRRNLGSLTEVYEIILTRLGGKSK